MFIMNFWGKNLLFIEDFVILHKIRDLLAFPQQEEAFTYIANNIAHFHACINLKLESLHEQHEVACCAQSCR